MIYNFKKISNVIIIFFDLPDSCKEIIDIFTCIFPVNVSVCFQGPMYPSLNVMLAQWAPPQERGRLGALVFAGK